MLFVSYAGRASPPQSLLVFQKREQKVNLVNLINPVRRSVAKPLDTDTVHWVSADAQHLWSAVTRHRFVFSEPRLAILTDRNVHGTLNGFATD